LRWGEFSRLDLKENRSSNDNFHDEEALYLAMN